MLMFIQFCMYCFVCISVNVFKYYMLVHDVLLEETNNDKPITTLGGCRTAKNTPEAPFNYTHGVLAWVTYNGYILNIEEILHRETTTFIIISFMKMFLWGNVWIDFYQRIVTLAFDVICGVLLRLFNIIKLGLIPLQSMYHWCSLMHCMALDKFHGFGHVRAICSADPKKGIVHPLLPKFKGILNQCPTRNEQVKIIYKHITMHIIFILNNLFFMIRCLNIYGVKNSID